MTAAVHFSQSACWSVKFLLPMGSRLTFCECISLILVCVSTVSSDRNMITVIADSDLTQYMNNFTILPLDEIFLTKIPSRPENGTECVGVNYSPGVFSICTILLVLIALLTVGGNFLVILAVILVRRLQTPSNILIVSLAFSDFFVGLLVLPFTIIDTLKGYWPFNEGLCDMYVSFDVLLCTASILNLCAISIDRYLVITRPLTYISARTPTLMAIMIIASWVISALISIPPSFGWKSPWEECKCEYSKDVGYQIYATAGAFYCPLLVMLILYGKIFKLAREMSRSEQLKMTPVGADEQIVVESKASQECAARPGALNNVRNSFGPGDKSPSSTTSKEDSKHKLISGKFQPRNKAFSKDSQQSYSKHCASNSFTSSAASSGDLRHRRGSADRKVIKTLGVIMGCFCLCWLPFFLVQLLRALLTIAGYNTDNFISVEAFKFLQWLGYINSVLNPIIYAKFNTEFRLPFKMILLFKCNRINARLRSATFSSEYGLPSNSSKRDSNWVRSVPGRSKRRSRGDSSSAASRNRPRPQSHLHDFQPTGMIKENII
ncbi:unnamed protein product [Calicophoron daubneyi]|uniref:G-protein coupled receptors family 1 profile domain-containing protein n=1 Tax=Calicophoron daubneyi TaxID=300641 RepID=A0AAV2TX12_CALDB